MSESAVKLYNPLNFIAGPGVIQQIGEFARPFGRRALLIGSEHSLRAAGDAIRQSLGGAGISYAVHSFSGIPSDEAAQSYAAVAASEGAEIIIAAGGGRVLDTGKAAAAIADLPVITVPTISATNASFRRNTIMYNGQGSYVRREPNKQSPRYVLADTNILAGQPRRYLDAGIIDSLVRLYESEPYVLIYEGRLPFEFNYSIAKELYRFFSANEKAIHHDFGEGKPTALVNDTVTAIIGAAGIASNYLSDIQRGGFAHPFYNEVTWVNPARTYLHGEIVGLGILVQLQVLGVSEARFEQEFALLRSYGLDYTMEDIGIGSGRMEELSRRLYENHVPRLPFLRHVRGEEEIRRAILRVDRRIRQARETEARTAF